MENKKINEYEIDNESKINEIRAKRIAAIALALTAGGASALTGCSNNTQNVKNETKVTKETKETKEQENVLEDLEKEITKKYESFSEENKFSIMESILRGNAADNKYENATEAQKKFYNKIENFIYKFHEETHKENNFRIAEDGENYLDLSIWEVACLDLLLNDYSKEELSEIWGNITVDEKSLTEVTQTALDKIITYYTNAKEKSGVAELIEDKEKKAAFEKQEEKVLAVNKNPSDENIYAIIDSPEYQEVYFSDNTNLEKMDLASFISTIPLVSFTVANLDAVSTKEVHLNNYNLGLEIMGKKVPELAKNLTEVSEKIERNNVQLQNSMTKQISESAKIVEEVSKRLTKLDETNNRVVNVADELKTLQNALQNPKQRGVLGEFYLAQVLENVLPPNAFQIQYKFKNGEIVDAAIFLDQHKILPVDSKFSLENYNRMIESEGEERKILAKKVRDDLKMRIDETSKYIRPDENTMDFAFMFIPSESLYYDMLINKVGSQGSERDLIEYAFRDKRVIVVSPTSFMAYLQTVLQGLKSLKIEEQSKEIQKRVSQLGTHISKYEDLMQRLGKSLGTTVNHFNNAHKELGKIDKDVVKIAGEDSKSGVEPQLLDKPRE